MSATTADFLTTPEAAGFTVQGDTATLLARLAPRATVEITKNGKARFERVVSVTRASDGALDVTFGEWRSNPFRPDLLAFEVSAVQPSTRYKSATGAARAVSKWLGGAR